MPTIRELIPSTVGHAFEKLSDGFLTSDIGLNTSARKHLAVYGINAVASMFENVRAELASRGIRTEELIEPSVFYAINRIREHLDPNVPAEEKIDEPTGWIFVSYLNAKYKQLREAAKDYD